MKSNSDEKLKYDFFFISDNELQTNYRDRVANLWPPWYVSPKKSNSFVYEVFYNKVLHVFCETCVVDVRGGVG